MPVLPAPIVCLVTDRQRLAAAWRWQDPISALLAQVKLAVEASVDLVQIREPDLPGGVLETLVTRAVEVARGRPTRIVVNDRLDVALAAGAAGVHLRGNSFDAGRVRAVAPPGFLVGRSVHDVDEASRAAASDEVDYLVFGTVFPSLSKPGGRRVTGVEELGEVVRRVGVPVLAIGGVTPETVAAVRRAGAAGFAAIGFFIDAEAGGGRWPEAARAARRWFDTSGTIP